MCQIHSRTLPQTTTRFTSTPTPQLKREVTKYKSRAKKAVTSKYRTYAYKLLAELNQELDNRALNKADAAIAKLQRC